MPDLLAARVGDKQLCPVPTHGGGDVQLVGNSTNVSIEDKLAAIGSGSAPCQGGAVPCRIAEGCGTVKINDHYAGRVTDRTEHVGVIVSSASRVYIGVTGDAKQELPFHKFKTKKRELDTPLAPPENDRKDDKDKDKDKSTDKRKAKIQRIRIRCQHDGRIADASGLLQVVPDAARNSALSFEVAGATLEGKVDHEGTERISAEVLFEDGFSGPCELSCEPAGSAPKWAAGPMSNFAVSPPPQTVFRKALTVGEPPLVYEVRGRCEGQESVFGTVEVYPEAQCSFNFGFEKDVPKEAFLACAKEWTKVFGPFRVSSPSKPGSGSFNASWGWAEIGTNNLTQFKFGLTAEGSTGIALRLDGSLGVLAGMYWAIPPDLGYLILDQLGDIRVFVELSATVKWSAKFAVEIPSRGVMAPQLGPSVAGEGSVTFGIEGFLGNEYIAKVTITASAAASMTVTAQLAAKFDGLYCNVDGSQSPLSASVSIKTTSKWKSDMPLYNGNWTQGGKAQDKPLDIGVFEVKDRLLVSW